MHSFIYLRCPYFGQKWGQSSMTTDQRAYIGIYGHWPLTPLIHILLLLPRYAKLYLFYESSRWSNKLEPNSHWNRTSLKIWPLYKRSMTVSYFDLYLKNETLYEFCVIGFFARYDPRKNFTCITILSKHVDYFSAM